MKLLKILFDTCVAVAFDLFFKPPIYAMNRAFEFKIKFKPTESLRRKLD